MPTLKEVLKELSGVRQRKAVLEHLLTYLENEFETRDEGDPPQVLKTSTEGETVSQDAIADVMHVISNDLIGPLQVREAELNTSDVRVGDAPKTKKPDKKTKKKPAKKDGED